MISAGHRRRTVTGFDVMVMMLFALAFVVLMLPVVVRAFYNRKSVRRLVKAWRRSGWPGEKDDP